MTAIFLSGNSDKKRRINSSVNEDFPAPPVPVIPSTGVFFDISRAFSTNAFASSLGLFTPSSATLIK